MFRRALGDFGMVVLCTVTVFIVLASPLVPYDFTNDVVGLEVWTLIGGSILGFIGIWLNRRAEAETRSRQRK